MTASSRRLHGERRSGPTVADKLDALRSLGATLKSSSEARRSRSPRSACGSAPTRAASVIKAGLSRLRQADSSQIASSIESVSILVYAIPLFIPQYIQAYTNKQCTIMPVLAVAKSSAYKLGLCETEGLGKFGQPTLGTTICPLLHGPTTVCSCQSALAMSGSSDTKTSARHRYSLFIIRYSLFFEYTTYDIRPGILSLLNTLAILQSINRLRDKEVMFWGYYLSIDLPTFGISRRSDKG
jgi:hypothetical protein